MVEWLVIMQCHWLLRTMIKHLYVKFCVVLVTKNAFPTSACHTRVQTLSWVATTTSVRFTRIGIIGHLTFLVVYACTNNLLLLVTKNDTDIGKYSHWILGSFSISISDCVWTWKGIDAICDMRVHATFRNLRLTNICNIVNTEQRTYYYVLVMQKMSRSTCKYGIAWIIGASCIVRGLK